MLQQYNAHFHKALLRLESKKLTVLHRALTSTPKGWTGTPNAVPDMAEEAQIPTATLHIEGFYVGYMDGLLMTLASLFK